MCVWVKQNVVFANCMIDELIKEKPFSLVLSSGDVGSLYAIAKEMQYGELVDQLEPRVKNGTGIQIQINQDNADKLYHVLSSYLVGK